MQTYAIWHLQLGTVLLQLVSRVCGCSALICDDEDQDLIPMVVGVIHRAHQRRQYGIRPAALKRLADDDMFVQRTENVGVDENGWRIGQTNWSGGGNFVSHQ